MTPNQVEEASKLVYDLKRVRERIIVVGKRTDKHTKVRCGPGDDPRHWDSSEPSFVLTWGQLLDLLKAEERDLVSHLSDLGVTA